MERFYVIESFQDPNFKVDVLAKLLTDPEYKLFDITLRKTLGDIRRIKELRASISYSEFRRLSGQCDSTISKALRGLLTYKVLLKVPGQVHPARGQEYLPNLAVSFKKDRKKRMTWMHCSCRLMDIAGLEVRKEERVMKNRRKTANARKKKTERLAAAQRSVAQRSQRSVPQRADSSVEQRLDSSVIQKDLNTGAKTQGEHPTPTNPYFAPLDPLTGRQVPVTVCESAEQQTIFDFLERKLRKDKRVQQYPPRQTYKRIFKEVMRIRQISAWELQRLINGLLTDKMIDNPLGALRCPDKFSTEYYLMLADAQETNAVPGDRPGDVWQATLAVLERRVEGANFSTWFSPISGSFDETTLEITVPDDAFIYWLKKHYTEVILESVEQVAGFRPALQFTLQEPQSLERKGGGDGYR